MGRFGAPLGTDSVRIRCALSAFAIIEETTKMQKPRGFWSSVVGGLVLLTMVLSGCGGGGGTTAGNQPKSGGTIIDAISQEPSSLMTAQSTQAFAALVDASIWAPLMYADDQGAIQPGLLTQVPSSTNGGIAVNGNTETITLKLRPNLKWSDGQPLTSDDVAFAITTFSDTKYGDKQGFQNKEIDHVATPDAQTTVITLNTLDVTFPIISLTDVLGFTPLPKHHYGTMTADQIAADFQPTVTSGPFTLKERVKGDHITVTKNKNYYQAPKPYLDGITFKYFPDAQTIVQALQAGQVDTAYFLPVDAKSTLTSIPGYSLYQPSSAGASYEALYFNISNPVLADVKVREALAIGFDIKTEISQIQKGNAVPTCDDGDGTFAHDTSLVQNGYCPYGPDQFAGFDQTKAGQLLDSAGWTMGSDGFRHKGSQKLALRISTTSGRQYREDSEALIKAAWKTIGVDLTIANHPSSDLFGPVLFPSDHKYDKSNNQWDVAEFANGITDPGSANLIWTSTQVPSVGGQNLTYYNNPTVDQMFVQQSTQFDQTQRKATFHQIYTQILKDVPTVYLYSALDLSEYKSTLHNYKPIAVGGIECWNVWDWWVG
jgi:peptide/nickel transport system substrate-binding protein